MIQSADSGGRLRQINNTALGAVVWTLALPGRSVQTHVGQAGPWPGVFHPSGFAILFCSALLAWMLATIPFLVRWSDRAGLVLASGFAAFLACAFVVAWLSPIPEPIRRIWETRQRITRHIRQRIRAVQGDERADLDHLATVARGRIDNEIVPAFLSFVRYNLSLAKQIHELEQAVPPPEAEVLQPLRDRYEARLTATWACSQLAADAEARLVLLLQGSGERELAGNLDAWTQGLEELLDVFQGPDPVKNKPTEVEPEPSPPILPSDAEFTRDLEWTLRHLNNPSLGKSPLSGRMANSIQSALHRRDVLATEPTVQEKGQALRDLVIEVIEGLKLTHRAPSEQPLGYYVLWEHYVMGLTHKVVMQRHLIPTASYWRIRTSAVESVAGELSQRERRL